MKVGKSHGLDQVDTRIKWEGGEESAGDLAETWILVGH